MVSFEIFSKISYKQHYFHKNIVLRSQVKFTRNSFYCKVYLGVHFIWKTVLKPQINTAQYNLNSAVQSTRHFVSDL